MLSRSIVGGGPGSQRVGLSVLAEAWAGEKLILAAACSCRFFSCRVVFVGGCLTAIRRVSIRLVWLGRLGAMLGLVVCSRARGMTEKGLQGSIDQYMSQKSSRRDSLW